MRISNRHVIPLILGLTLAGTTATQASAATTTSTKWAGYVAGSSTPNTYDDVSATWVVPTITCTTRGIVLFWVGLDGWNSSTVERAGVGADCTSGSPTYFVQFFTGIEGSTGTPTAQIGTVPGFPVKPGDSVTAEVSFDYQDTQYDISLASSEGWTSYNPVAAPLGYQNTSAEVVTEALGYNGAVSPLPSFTPAHFTYSLINGSPLSQSGAQAVNMVNASGGVIAGTSGYDSSGENFTVTYTGP